VDGCFKLLTNFFEAKVHEYALATCGDYSEDTDF
jgi:hypothetical protein